MRQKASLKWHVGIVASFLLLAVACVLVSTVGYDITLGYQYNNEVHSHMENAFNAADPVTMRAEIISAEEGMRNLGLKPEMYDGLFPWEHTSDRQMKWQYTHLDSILTRLDEFQRWEDSQGTTTSSQQMQDVYTSKLNNIRNFITQDGGSDWIAEGTFLVYNGFAFIIAGWLSILFFVCFAITGSIVVFKIGNNDYI